MFSHIHDKNKIDNGKIKNNKKLKSDHKKTHLMTQYFRVIAFIIIQFISGRLFCISAQGEIHPALVHVFS